MHRILEAPVLEALDTLYSERDAHGRPISWGLLVERLREIRRAIERGESVVVHSGQVLSSVLDFHTWAYLRYKLLEEGYDAWIGDDQS